MLTPLMFRLARLALVIACAVSALAWATDGFRGLTSEAIRMERVARQPVPVPPVWLVDQSGRRFELGGPPTARRPVLLVDFVYTRCQSVCSAMGSRFQQLQRDIARQGLTGRMRLLSISFDPASDTSSAIARYAARMHADPAIWQIARVAEPAALPPLLDTFGIRVIAAPLDQFEHNAAFHVVNARGELVRILDLETDNTILIRDAALYASVAPVTRTPP
ncbi:SCO family protein [Burkholderia ambifaria]|uniref:SCO family protein n=1 Tax=Burkholderia ambifaria TaxID=152480 RepID=UPI0015903FED|nr:SCO family protein [Burkholderia ambifaria]